MDLSSISPEAVVGQQMQAMAQEFATRVMRRTLDIEAQQGAQLAQLVAQSAGLGGQVDVQA